MIENNVHTDINVAFILVYENSSIKIVRLFSIEESTVFETLVKILFASKELAAKKTSTVSANIDDGCSIRLLTVGRKLANPISDVDTIKTRRLLDTNESNYRRVASGSVLAELCESPGEVDFMIVSRG